MVNGTTNGRGTYRIFFYSTTNGSKTEFSNSLREAKDRARAAVTARRADSASVSRESDDEHIFSAWRNNQNGPVRVKAAKPEPLALDKLATAAKHSAAKV